MASVDSIGVITKKYYGVFSNSFEGLEVEEGDEKLPPTMQYESCPN